MIPRSTKLAYGVGNSLISVKNMLFHFFFLFYFSNVLGVSEFLVITAIMVALIVDAFSDPIMGQISDNFRSDQWGRRHLFMLWGIVPTAIALALLFSPPDGLGQIGLFFWMLGFLLMVRIGLTVFGVPYYALGAELSDDYNERTSIVGYREFFNNFFSILVFVVGLLIFLPETPEFEDGMMNEAGYAPFVITMAIIGTIGALLSAFGTRRKIPEIRNYSDDERTRWTATLRQLKLAARVPNFLWLNAGLALVLILYGTISSLSFYIGGNFWRFTQEEKFLIAVIPILVLVPAVIFAAKLAARIDKKPAIRVFVLIFGICGIIPYAAYFLGLTAPIGDPANLLLVLLFHALSFVGLAGVLIISNSMLADLADVMESQTGKRQEGVLYAAFSFVQKLTFIFGTTTAGIALAVINFPKQTDPSQIAQSTIDGLGWTVIVVTAILTGLGLFAFNRYKLNRAAHAAIQAVLQK